MSTLNSMFIFNCIHVLRVHLLFKIAVPNHIKPIVCIDCQNIQIESKEGIYHCLDRTFLEFFHRNLKQIFTPHKTS